MAVNEVVTITVVVNVSATAAGAHLDQYGVGQWRPDRPGDHEQQRERADGGHRQRGSLRQVKTVSPNPAVPGQSVTYQIVVSNAGPTAAADVKITDTIPTALTGVTASPSQGTCTGGNCDLGTIPAGGSASVTIVGTVNPAVTAGFTNNVTVGSPTSDPIGGNNTAAAPSTVAPDADLVWSSSARPRSTAADHGGGH